MTDQIDPRAAFFAALGGHEMFERLTTRFYAEVAADPQFRAMYPEADLEPARLRLMWFLEQYFGGPTTYGERRGHPRLRMRHQPFTITLTERDTWLRHMRTALDEVALDPAQDEVLWDYFTRAADAMVNAHHH